MSKSDIITIPRFIAKIPTICWGLPGLLRGLKISNSTDKTKPVGLGLCVEAATEKNPDGIAIIQDDYEITYRDFNALANKIAHYLLSIGIIKGDCVVLLIENRPELLACAVACAKIGAVSAMVNTSQRRNVLAHSINLVKPKLVFVGEEKLTAFNEISELLERPLAKKYFIADADSQQRKTCQDSDNTPKDWLNLMDVILSHSDLNPSSSSKIYPEDACFYIYTSGTTGMPKAVVFNHGRFMKSYGGIGIGVLRFKPSDRAYISLPFYHSTALAVCWGGVLAGCSTLVIARKFSVSNFWQDIRRHKVTTFGYVGELCRYLLDAPPQSNDKDNQIRLIFGNGLRPNVWKPFKERFAISRVMELYASSEGNVVFCNLLNFDNTVGYSPIEYAIVNYDQNSETAIKNSQGFMQKVEKGDAGLLLGKITAKAPFHGYTDAEKTDKCIMKDVFSQGDSWFNTGDLMRDLGFKHAQFVDRIGDTYRWKGENVSAAEVEHTLDQLAPIAESIVYGVEIPNTNGRAGMAIIRLADKNVDFSLDELLNYLRQELPAFAIPVFIRLSESIETTSTFKHKKAPLKEAGYDLDKINDSIYALLPKTNNYVALHKEIQLNIDNGVYKF